MWLLQWLLRSLLRWLLWSTLVTIVVTKGRKRTNISFRCTGSGYDKERFNRLNFFFAFQFTLSGRNDSKEKRNRRKTLLSQSTSRRKGVSAAENCVKVSFLSVTSDFRNYSYFLLTQPVVYKIQYNFIFSPIDNFNLDFVPSSS